MTSEDIRKMRLKITLAAYRGERFDDGDGNGSLIACAIAGAAIRAGEAGGLSGEDTMTLLAFEALKCAEKLMDLEVQRAMLELPPRSIVTKDMPL
jgi:hypothetical protein